MTSYCALWVCVLVLERGKYEWIWGVVAHKRLSKHTLINWWLEQLVSALEHFQLTGAFFWLQGLYESCKPGTVVGMSAGAVCPWQTSDSGIRIKQYGFLLKVFSTCNLVVAPDETKVICYFCKFVQSGIVFGMKNFQPVFCREGQRRAAINSQDIPSQCKLFKKWIAK